MDVIVVGAGYAGSIVARKFADDGKKVKLIERRNHIAGNMYDYEDEHGILIHKYGPHIATMNILSTVEFLSQYTDFIPYEHHVKAQIDDKQIFLPVNIGGIMELLGEEKGEKIVAQMVRTYGEGSNIPILTLLENPNEEIKALAELIYEKVFLHYTMKMWDLRPDEIDPSVTARIPIRLSHDNRHFQMMYQKMPKDGYTSLFEKMLDHPNIDIQLSTDVFDVLSFSEEKHEIWYHGNLFLGKVVYTGALDYLFSYSLGRLPFRSLKFAIESFPQEYIQDVSVLNWPDSRPATRRTEMKRLTQQIIPDITTTITEYPGAYDKSIPEYSEPYYPIIEKNNKELQKKYLEKAKKFNNLYTVGRLADYRYYNMEAIIQRTLSFYEEIK